MPTGTWHPRLCIAHQRFFLRAPWFLQHRRRCSVVAGIWRCNRTVAAAALRVLASGTVLLPDTCWCGALGCGRMEQVR